MQEVTTTKGEKFTHEDHMDLAALIFRRWGRDPAAFCVAWRRLFQNDAPDSEIMKLVPHPERAYPTHEGRPITYHEAGKSRCTGADGTKQGFPCPSCAVAEDDRNDYSNTLE